jgi:hypothetical protein
MLTLAVDIIWSLGYPISDEQPTISGVLWYLLLTRAELLLLASMLALTIGLRGCYQGFYMDCNDLIVTS